MTTCRMLSCGPSLPSSGLSLICANSLGLQARQESIRLLLACHLFKPIYCAPIIVLCPEADILESDCDNSFVHHLLLKIPQDLPFGDE